MQKFIRTLTIYLHKLCTFNSKSQIKFDSRLFRMEFIFNSVSVYFILAWLTWKFSAIVNSFQKILMTRSRSNFLGFAGLY